MDQKQGIKMEYEYAKDSLKWASLIYLAAVLASVAILVYFILSYIGRL